MENTTHDKPKRPRKKDSLRPPVTGSESVIFDNSELGKILSLTDRELVSACAQQIREILGTEKFLALVLFGIVETDDLAMILRKKPSTIKNQIARRELPFVRLGDRNIVLRDSYRDWLQSMETKPNGCQ